jgi:hypothetical protein
VRRKIIQDLANTLCQMLVGWRMTEDLEILAALPDGTLSIDVLSGTVSHDVAGDIQLYIGGELQSWLSHRFRVYLIPLQAVLAAMVTAQIRTDLLVTNRQRIVSFDFSIRSLITTNECSYIGQLQGVHRWYTRISSNNAFNPSPLRGSA